MATFNVTADLTKTPLTRQDLYDAWTTAALGTIVADELADGFLSVTVASTYSDAPSAPSPGALMWVADEQTMFCYHDEIDGTGVSLWLAIGPDVFETAGLLAEPAWPGALVEPDVDRYVAPVNYTGSRWGDGVHGKMIGNVHSGVPYPLNSRTPDTLSSGTWVRVGIDGFTYGWVPNASGVSEGLFACIVERGFGAAPVDASRSATDMRGGMILTNNTGGREGFAHPYFGFCGHTLYTAFNGGSPSNWGMHVRYRFTGFRDLTDRTP